MTRTLALSITAALLMMSACGSDDDAASDDSSGDATPETVADADDDAAEPADAAADDDAGATDDDAAATDDEPAADAAPTGAGSATVTLEGETYQFAQIEPGAGDDWYVFCTTVAGSLQAVLRQVDDAGNPVDGELSVLLLEPGGAFEQTGDPAEVSLDLGAERSLRYEEGDPMSLPADGRTAEGTVTLSEMVGFDNATGEMQLEPFEVSLQVSC